MKKNPIIIGTLFLSLSGLLCRGIGFFYRLFISQAFGEEAMGIFQLTSPVFMLAFSLTCAGMQTAVSRYTASCLAVKNTSLAKKYLLCGCVISLTLSFVYSFIIFVYAENISLSFLQEKRCTSLLRICAFSFPFAALHSCFNGYFYGCRETKIPSLTQISEQVIRVGIVLLLYYYFLSLGKQPTIAFSCIGLLSGEVISFLISWFLFLIYTKDTHFPPFASTFPLSPKSTLKNTGNTSSFSASHSPYKNHTSCSFPSSKDRSRQSHKISLSPFTSSQSCFSISCQLIGMSFPLTLSRVIVNLLQSYETVSLPARLRSFGYSSETALSIYGVLTGMALSLVLFPSTFTNSASVLLLPSVSQSASGKNFGHLKKTIRQTIFFSSILGFFFTAFFFFFGDYCGKFLFDSTMAGGFICQLSFLCPFLYLHTTLSSILNGLKKTVATLFISVSALGIRLFFTLYLVPTYGIQSYLWGLLLSELISSIFCLYFLKDFIFFTDDCPHVSKYSKSFVTFHTHTNRLAVGEERKCK